MNSNAVCVCVNVTYSFFIHIVSAGRKQGWKFWMLLQIPSFSSLHHPVPALMVTNNVLTLNLIGSGHSTPGSCNVSSKHHQEPVGWAVACSLCPVISWQQDKAPYLRQAIPEVFPSFHLVSCLSHLCCPGFLTLSCPPPSFLCWASIFDPSLSCFFHIPSSILFLPRLLSPSLYLCFFCSRPSLSIPPPLTLFHFCQHPLSLATEVNRGLFLCSAWQWCHCRTSWSEMAAALEYSLVPGDTVGLHSATSPARHFDLAPFHRDGWIDTLTFSICLC